MYAGASWVLPVMASVVAGSLATFFGRRAGLAPPVVAGSAFLAIWVTSSELVLWGTTQAGLPLLGTLRAASLASRQAAAAFMATADPAHAAPGFVLWSAWGAGAAVVASDLLAVRLRSMAAVFPPLLVFLATCVLGLPSGRAWALTTFTAATLAFVLVHQWALGAPAIPTTFRKGRAPGAAYPPAPRVLPRRSRRGGPFTTSGTVLAGVAVLAGAVLVPALGKEGSGTAHWRQDFDVATRVAPDPLVSLQTDLFQGAHTPVFVVRSTAAAYWRLTSLQHFDGTSWTGSGSYREVHNRLPGGDVLVGTRQVDETFDIQELGSPWLPVAFRPESVSSRAAASYDATSGSLLTRGQTADGETYKVVAAEELATLSPALLARVKPITAEDRSTLAQFLQLPRGIPASIRHLARTLMNAATVEYQKALALQDFFRRPPFVYTLRPPEGSGSSSLVSFLFRTHAGYCQQYAAAYAVLARLAGLPSRVAVGFVTGTSIGPILGRSLATMLTPGRKSGSQAWVGCLSSPPRRSRSRAPPNTPARRARLSLDRGWPRGMPSSLLGRAPRRLASDVASPTSVGLGHAEAEELVGGTWAVWHWSSSPSWWAWRRGSALCEPDNCCAGAAVATG